MGCRLLWWAQAMLLGSLKQGVQAAFGKSYRDCRESVPFSFGGMGAWAGEP